MPVRVQRKADTVASIVVSKHVLVHQGDGSNNEPEEPDRDQDHLRAGTSNINSEELSQISLEK